MMSEYQQPLRQPACANCARRKTKCDRNAPCSSCAAAKFECYYVEKRPKKRRRIQPSSRYEEDLNHTNRQLEALSNTLRSLVEKNEGPSQQRSVNNRSSSTSTFNRDVAERLNGKESTASTDQRSCEVESFFDQRLDNTTDTSDLSAPYSLEDTAGTKATAIDIVQTLIQDAKAPKLPTCDEELSQSAPSAFSQYPELATLSLPPMDSVLRLLAFSRELPQRYFVNFPHTDEDEFAALCQRVYFPTQPYTVFAWINVNCGLLYLFRDLDKVHFDRLHLTSERASSVVALCFTNVDRAVKSLRLCVQPSYEAVDALICATVVSMDDAKGYLAWKLLAAAARMCVDLGYHRLPAGPGDQLKSRKRKLFWYVYSMDRSLAFNLGRSPTIQDCDVTTERPIPSDDLRCRWGFHFREYIEFAKTQYEIYEQLLSAKAQQGPLPLRVSKVHRFAAMISHFRDDFRNMLNQADQPPQGIGRDAIYSADIGFYSILTLIYRLLPPDDSLDTHGTTPAEPHPLRFNTLCVESGRAALNALVRGWSMVSNDLDEDGSKVFINWTSFFIPFMPFIAVFGNQIITGNDEDLSLLTNVFKIVEKAAAVSSAMEKVRKAFSRLLAVAELWTKKENGRGETQVQDGVADLDTIASTTANLPVADAQDVEILHQDWDTIFSEFDLGIGAESARDMMPWFEQHMPDFNALG